MVTWAHVKIILFQRQAQDLARLMARKFPFPESLGVYVPVELEKKNGGQKASLVEKGRWL